MVCSAATLAKTGQMQYLMLYDGKRDRLSWNLISFKVPADLPYAIRRYSQAEIYHSYGLLVDETSISWRVGKRRLDPDGYTALQMYFVCILPYIPYRLGKRREFVKREGDVVTWRKPFNDAAKGVENSTVLVTRDDISRNSQLIMFSPTGLLRMKQTDDLCHDLVTKGGGLLERNNEDVAKMILDGMPGLTEIPKDDSKVRVNAPDGIPLEAEVDLFENGIR